MDFYGYRHWGLTAVGLGLAAMIAVVIRKRNRKVAVHSCPSIPMHAGRA
jgi:LPXTG-motif cell wall-anchored protein